MGLNIGAYADDFFKGALDQFKVATGTQLAAVLKKNVDVARQKSEPNVVAQPTGRVDSNPGAADAYKDELSKLPFVNQPWFLPAAIVGGAVMVGLLLKKR